MKKTILAGVCFFLLLLSACFDSNSKEIRMGDIGLFADYPAVCFDVVFGPGITDIKSVGVVIAKGEIKNAGDLTTGTCDYEVSGAFSETKSIFIFSDIGESDYNNNFSARAFLVRMKGGKEETVYSPHISVFNMYELAKANTSAAALEIIAVVEGDYYVPVRTTFDLDGGFWTEDIGPFIVSSYDSAGTATLTGLNESSPFIAIIAGTSANFYGSYYKIFIKNVAGTAIFRIVGIEDGNKDIIRSGVSDYDYVICAHPVCEDEETLAVIKQYAEEGPIGTFLEFDEDIAAYSGGEIVATFYPFSMDGSLEITVGEAVSMPKAGKDGYHFGGWSDGENTHTVFPLFKATDDIAAAEYQAVWELYSIEEFRADMKDLIPEVISGDIALPAAYSGYSIRWESTHPDILSNEGHYSRPSVNTVITLFAYLTADSVTEEVSFELKASEYKSLGGFVASSYIYRDYHTVTDEFFDTLDIINCAFVTATAAGSISGTNVLENIKRYILPKARQYGDYVVISVAPESSWSAMTSTAATRKVFVDNIISIINEYGLDGVDIDWEGSVNAANYTLLMEEVYTRVKANNPNHLVTTAITGGPYQPPNYNLRVTGRHIDFINLMMYGLTSNGGNYQNNLYESQSFHNPQYKVGRGLANCSIAATVANFKTAYNIPGEKIIVGAAFYGIKQKYGPNGTWVSGGSVYYSSLAANYLQNPDYTAYFDEIAGVPYILKNDGSEFISYDDPRSIALKSEFIKAEGLKGMMYWENGCDNTGILLAAMKRGLKQ